MLCWIIVSKFYKLNRAQPPNSKCSITSTTCRHDHQPSTADRKPDYRHSRIRRRVDHLTCLDLIASHSVPWTQRGMFIVIPLTRLDATDEGVAPHRILSPSPLMLQYARYHDAASPGQASQYGPISHDSVPRNTLLAMHSPGHGADADFETSLPSLAPWPSTGTFSHRKILVVLCLTRTAVFRWDVGWYGWRGL